MTTDLSSYDPVRSDVLTSWRFNPYRFPPRLVLSDFEVVEGEFVYDVERWSGRREGPYLDTTAVEDPRELLTETSMAEDAPESEEVAGPKPEKPVGVRVQWKRASDLMADAGAKVSGWGLDFTTALAERATGRTAQPVEESSSPASVRLAPANRYARPDYRAKTPVPPETIAR